MKIVGGITAAALLLAAAVSGGCASMGARSEPQTMWVKPGASPAELAQDRDSCVYDAHKAAPYADPNSLPLLQLAIECLKSKGWRLVPAQATQ